MSSSTSSSRSPLTPRAKVPVSASAFSSPLLRGVHTRGSLATSSPRLKRFVATKELFRVLQFGKYSQLTPEVISYFGVNSPAIFDAYRRCVEGDLISPAELVTAAGSGILLTALLRSIVADAPEIMVPFDPNYAERRQSYARNWAPFENREGLPGKALTKLAVERTREANARGVAYVRAHPAGDGGATYKAYQEKLWEEAERKVVG